MCYNPSDRDYFLNLTAEIYMKIFLSYALNTVNQNSNLDPQPNKFNIDVFIKALSGAGLPEDNYTEISNEFFCGIELNTEGTVLFVEQDWGGSLKCFYGNRVLLERQSNQITVDVANLGFLPRSILLTPEQIAEEQELVDNLINQEMNKVAMPSVSATNRQPRYNKTTIKKHFKPLIEEGWKNRQYNGDELKSKVDRTLDRVTEQYEQRKHNYDLTLLKTQLLALMEKVCEMPGHSKNDGDKYRLLLGIKQKITNTNFTKIDDYNTFIPDNESLACAAKNFIVLALQRDKWGYSDRTASGEKIKELLNAQGYAELRQCLFETRPENTSINYAELLEYSGYSSTESKVKFFSSQNKRRTYTLYSSKENEDRFLSQDEIRTFVNGNG